MRSLKSCFSKTISTLHSSSILRVQYSACSTKAPMSVEDKSNITVFEILLRLRYSSDVYALLNVYACVAGTKLFKSSSPWLQRHPTPPKSSKTASPANSSSYLRFSARAQPLPPLEQSYWKKWIQPAVGLPLTVQSWCWPPILIFCLDFGALDFGSTVLACFGYGFRQEGCFRGCNFFHTGLSSGLPQNFLSSDVLPLVFSSQFFDLPSIRHTDCLKHLCCFIRKNPNSILMRLLLLSYFGLQGCRSLHPCYSCNSVGSLTSVILTFMICTPLVDLGIQHLLT